MSPFDTWWHNEGSGMAPGTSEDLSEFTKRIAAVAWEKDSSNAPVLSKYHGVRGFELERFIADYEAWRESARAALAKSESPTA